MVTPPRQDFSRESLVEWARNAAPDLRIGKALIDGKRACFARFTYAGAAVELEALGDDPDVQIARDVVEALRSLMHLPPLFDADKTAALEQEIVAAHLAGESALCDTLTRQLLLGRQPRALQAKTSFSKREIW